MKSDNFCPHCKHPLGTPPGKIHNCPPLEKSFRHPCFGHCNFTSRSFQHWKFSFMMIEEMHLTSKISFCLGRPFYLCFRAELVGRPREGAEEKGEDRQRGAGARDGKEKQRGNGEALGKHERQNGVDGAKRGEEWLLLCKTNPFIANSLTTTSFSLRISQ